MHTLWVNNTSQRPVAEVTLSESKRVSTSVLPGTARRCNLWELIVQKADGRVQFPAAISLARWEDQLNFIINKV